MKRNITRVDSVRCSQCGHSESIEDAANDNLVKAYVNSFRRDHLPHAEW